jgi:hypothetical protein
MDISRTDWESKQIHGQWRVDRAQTSKETRMMIANTSIVLYGIAWLISWRVEDKHEGVE